MPGSRRGPARREVLMGAGAAAVGAAAAAEPSRCCPVVELRQYTLRKGRRDELITLFDREFVETQEAAGARVMGQFRDLDDPDRFVWLRGFPAMEARREALDAFYGGPVWRTHSAAANATMLDSDNVLLLRPAAPGGGFALGPRGGPPSAAVVSANLHYLNEDQLAPFADFFESQMRPAVEADGAAVLASFVTETAPNTFPRLPVRSAERVFVWFTRFDDAAAESIFRQRHRARLGWRDVAPESLLPAFARKPEVLRLSPTSRSALR